MVTDAGVDADNEHCKTDSGEYDPAELTQRQPSTVQGGARGERQNDAAHDDRLDKSQRAVRKGNGV